MKKDALVKAKNNILHVFVTLLVAVLAAFFALVSTPAAYAGEQKSLTSETIQVKPIQNQIMECVAGAKINGSWSTVFSSVDTKSGDDTDSTILTNYLNNNPEHKIAKGDINNTDVYTYTHNFSDGLTQWEYQFIMFHAYDVTPTVTIYDGDKELVQGIDADYILEYSNNTDLGTATVKIIGQNDYAGSERLATFDIVGYCPYFVISKNLPSTTDGNYGVGWVSTVYYSDPFTSNRSSISLYIKTGDQFVAYNAYDSSRSDRYGVLEIDESSFDIFSLDVTTTQPNYNNGWNKTDDYIAKVGAANAQFCTPIDTVTIVPTELGKKILSEASNWEFQNAHLIFTQYSSPSTANGSLVYSLDNMNFVFATNLVNNAIDYSKSVYVTTTSLGNQAPTKLTATSNVAAYIYAGDINTTQNLQNYVNGFSLDTQFYNAAKKLGVSEEEAAELLTTTYEVSQLEVVQGGVKSTAATLTGAITNNGLFKQAQKCVDAGLWASGTVSTQSTSEFAIDLEYALLPYNLSKTSDDYTYSKQKSWKVVNSVTKKTNNAEIPSGVTIAVNNGKSIGAGQDLSIEDLLKRTSITTTGFAKLGVDGQDFEVLSDTLSKGYIKTTSENPASNDATIYSDGSEVVYSDADYVVEVKKQNTDGTFTTVSSVNEAGTYSITITGLSEMSAAGDWSNKLFAGSETATFTVEDRTPITNATISLTNPTELIEVASSVSADDVVANGLTKDNIVYGNVNVDVKLDGTTLTAGSDYTVEIASYDAKAGTLTLNVSGCGDSYRGTKQVTLDCAGIILLGTNNGSVAWTSVNWPCVPTSSNFTVITKEGIVKDFSVTAPKDLTSTSLVSYEEDGTTPQQTVTLTGSNWSGSTHVHWIPWDGSTLAAAGDSGDTKYNDLNKYYKLSGLFTPNTYSGTTFIYAGNGLDGISGYFKDLNTPNRSATGTLNALANATGEDAFKVTVDKENSDFITNALGSDWAQGAENGGFGVYTVVYDTSAIQNKLASLKANGLITFDLVNTSIQSTLKATILPYDLSNGENASYAISDELNDFLVEMFFDDIVNANNATNLAGIPHGSTITVNSGKAVAVNTSYDDVVKAVSVAINGYNYNLNDDTYAQAGKDYDINFYYVEDDQNTKVTSFDKAGTYKVEVVGKNSVSVEDFFCEDIETVLSNSAAFTGSASAEFEVLPHEAVNEWTNDSTSHWNTCSFPECSDESHVYNKADHTYGGWKLEKAATDSEPGSKSHTCTVCGYVQTVEIPAGYAISSTPVTGGTQLTLVINGATSADENITWEYIEASADASANVVSIDNNGKVTFNETGIATVVAYVDGIKVAQTKVLSTVAGTEIEKEAVFSEPQTDPKTGNSVSVSAEIPTAESYGITDGSTIELDLTPKAIDADQEQVAAAVQGQGTVKQIGGALDISLVLKDTEGNTEKLTSSEPITLTVSIALSDEDRERIKQGTHTLKILHQIVDGLEDLGGDYDPYADTIEIIFTTSHFSNFFVTLVGDDPTPAVETPSTVTETPAATTVAAVSDVAATSADGTTLAATGDAFGALADMFAGIAAAAVALLGALIWRRRKMQL